MAKRGVKVKDHEKLEPANIEKVILLLESDQPITKKDACAILNISYNTTRLNKIIAEHKEAKERRKARFKVKRAMPIDDKEIGRIVEEHLKGTTQTDIVEYLARPASVIKNVLSNYGVPERPKGDEKHLEAFLPDECVKESFTPGEIVWSAQYHRAAEIIKSLGKDKTGNFEVYQIYVFEPSEKRARAGRYHACASHSLGSLSHLKKYLDIDRLTS